MRNGYKASWDLVEGRYYIGEVGGNDNEVSCEDVHVLTTKSGGTNLGWPLCEGPCNNNDFPDCSCGKHDDPVFTWPHAGEATCLIGGFVYRGSMFPSRYQGAYFYGDYVKGFVKFLLLNSDGSVSSNEDFDDFSGGITSINYALNVSRTFLPL